MIPEKRKISFLPEDIFSFNPDQFYTFVRQSYGDDIAELFTFQSIRNGLHLINSSSDEILLVLQGQSKSIDRLKSLCCFEISENAYQIKLGVKLALNNFIESIKMKYAEENKRKNNRSSTRRVSSCSGSATVVDQLQSQNVITTPPSMILSPSTDDTSSIQSESVSTRNKLDAVDYIDNLKQRISEWWCHNSDGDSSFEHGTHYFLEINKSLNDSYVCVLSCQCRQRFKLPFMMTGVFKLSAFFRHLKEKHSQESLKMVCFLF